MPTDNLASFHPLNYAVSTNGILSDAVFLDAAAPLLEPRRLGVRLPEIRAGGVDVLLATAGALEGCAFTMRGVAEWLAIERAQHDRICIARKVADIRRAKAVRRTAVVLHFQGADPIEDNIDLLNAFHACGLRVMQLTYNARNRIGDGCFEPSDIGLSRFGRSVILRMEELGIVVDLAHAGVRTSLDAIATANRPVIVSHANARALCYSPRNIPDEVIRGVAESGGVVGACAAPFFLARDRTPSLDDLVAQIDHMVGLVGSRHVGLGFDFADEDEDDYVYFGYDERYIPHPPWTWPAGLAGHADARNIVKALSNRGYSERDIRGIIGENFLRVFAEVWGG